MGAFLRLPNVLAPQDCQEKLLDFGAFQASVHRAEKPQRRSVSYTREYLREGIRISATEGLEAIVVRTKISHDARRCQGGAT